jgi:hypothetical protein
MVDYSKWRTVDINSDDDESGISEVKGSSDRSAEEFLFECQIIKERADQVFNESLQHDNISSYSTAIAGYRDILSRIAAYSDRSQQTNTDTKHQQAVARARISCEMNIICCLIKTRSWNDALSESNEFEKSLPLLAEDIDHVVDVRRRYFKVIAMLNLVEVKDQSIHKINMEQVHSEVAAMKVLLSVADNIDKETMADYEELFQRLQPNIPHQPVDGYELLRKYAFKEALACFSQRIDDLRSDSSGIDANQLASLLVGKAEAQLSLSLRSEVRSAGYVYLKRVSKLFHRLRRALWKLHPSS